MEARPTTGGRSQLAVSLVALVALVVTLWQWPGDAAADELFARPEALGAGASAVARGRAAAPATPEPEDALPIDGPARRGAPTPAADVGRADEDGSSPPTDVPTGPTPGPTAPESPSVSTAPDPPPSRDTRGPTAPADGRLARPSGDALVAHVAVDEVQVHDRADGAVVTTFPRNTRFGQSTAFLVRAVGEGPAEGWLEVYLPHRPNGSTGWVRQADLRLYTNAWVVVVDLAVRRLRVYDGTRVVLDAAVTVGAAETPTPSGVAYVTDVVRTLGPPGPYGPYVLGLSLHSDVLDQFAGGDGQIGLHGTDRPDLLGAAGSHGCVRLHDDDISRLAGAVPLGTPVLLRA